MPIVLVGIGMLIPLMLSANATLQTALGIGPALVAVHLTGLGLTILPAALEHRWSTERGSVVGPILLTGGLVGLALVLLNNHTVPALGTPTVVALGLLGQGVASSAIDHFGWFGRVRTTWKRGQAAPWVVIVAGVGLVLGAGF